MVFNKSLLCLMAVLLSLACAQLQNSVELDPEGSFRLDWTVDSSADPNNPRIVFQTFVKTQGWFSIRWSSGTKADFLWAAYDSVVANVIYNNDMHCTLSGLNPTDACVSPTIPVNDVIDNINVVAASYNPSTNLTVLRFNRVQDTGDVAEDVPIPKGPFSMAWAFSDSIFVNGSPADITKRGATTITLIPA